MLTQRNTRQRGFTLIELVVVIVIIGILAAFAIPRFAGLAKDARVAAVRGMLGTVRSSSALVHGLALARSSTLTNGDGPIDLEGASGGQVLVDNYYPDGSADGIVDAIGNTENYTIDATTTPGTVIFQVNGATNMATCRVRYVEAPAGSVPTIDSDDTGC